MLLQPAVSLKRRLLMTLQPTISARASSVVFGANAALIRFRVGKKLRPLHRTPPPSPPANAPLSAETPYELALKRRWFVGRLRSASHAASKHRYVLWSPAKEILLIPLPLHSTMQVLSFCLLQRMRRQRICADTLLKCRLHEALLT